MRKVWCEEGLDVVSDFLFARCQDASMLVVLAEAMLPSKPALQSLQKGKQGRRGWHGKENALPEHRRDLQVEESSTQDEKPGGETSVPEPAKVAAVLPLQPRSCF